MTANLLALKFSIPGMILAIEFVKQHKFPVVHTKPAPQCPNIHAPTDGEPSRHRGVLFVILQHKPTIKTIK